MTFVIAINPETRREYVKFLAIICQNDKNLLFNRRSDNIASRSHTLAL